MVYYINFDGMGINVFDSQVFTPVKLLRAKGIDIRLISFEPDTASKACRSKLEEVERELCGSVISIRRLRAGFTAPGRYVKSICRYVKETNKDSSVIFHCRNAVAGYLALKAKRMLKGFNVKVLTDFRGAIAEECRLVYGKRGFAYRAAVPIVSNRLRHMEKYASRNSDFRFFVSAQLEAYMKNMYRLGIEGSKVIPTCIDAKTVKYDPVSRNELRKELGIEDRYVVVYSGSTREWQIPGRQVEVFAHIRRKLDNAFFLVLTRDTDTFTRLMQEHGVSGRDYLITACSHKDISKYLSCGDAAILLRDQDIVNTVSSPTKFAEYISCHLPVIVSKNIGDTGRIITEYRVGLFDSDIEGLNAGLAIEMRDSENFDTVIERYYDWNMKIEDIIETYTAMGYLKNSVPVSGEQAADNESRDKTENYAAVLP